MEARLARTQNELVVLELAIAAARRMNGRDLEREVCRLLVEQGGMLIAWVGRVDARSGNILPSASAGDSTGYLAALTASTLPGPHGEGPSGRCARTGRPAVCDDFSTDQRVAPWRTLALPRGIRSSAAVPVAAEGRTTRVLCVYSDEPRAFTPAVLAWLGGLADLLSIDGARNARQDPARPAPHA